MMFEEKNYVKEAINTLNAGWLEIKMAKLFGRKSTHQEGTVTVILSHWRNKVYLIDTIIKQ